MSKEVACLMLDEVLTFLVDSYSLKWTIRYLLDLGFTKDEIIAARFDSEDIDNVLESDPEDDI
ncbi:MAG: hypothetical protein K9M13_02060 [Simkaniaceae bacterium]|nr:hypothetical protein [Simkaniaceae bacterium]